MPRVSPPVDADQIGGRLDQRISRVEYVAWFRDFHTAIPPGATQTRKSTNQSGNEASLGSIGSIILFGTFAPAHRSPAHWSFIFTHAAMRDPLDDVICGDILATLKRRGAKLPVAQLPCGPEALA